MPVQPPAPSAAQTYATSSVIGGYTGSTTTPSGAAQTLPTATLNVVDTSTFPTSGTILVFGATGAPWQVVHYTGTTATSFTGCTGGSGSINGQNAVCTGNQAATLRRTVYYSANCRVTNNLDRATVEGVGTVGGQVLSVGVVGPSDWGVQQATGTRQTVFKVLMVVPCDPHGWYGVSLQAGSGGSVGVQSIIAVDG